MTIPNIPPSIRGRLLRRLYGVLWTIGGWLLRVLLRRGHAETVAYMRIRADAFFEEARERQAGGRGLVDWYKARARRWRRAAAWLAKRWPDVEGALEEAEADARRALRSVPRRVPAEVAPRR